MKCILQSSSTALSVFPDQEKQRTALFLSFHAMSWASCILQAKHSHRSTDLLEASIRAMVCHVYYSDDHLDCSIRCLIFSCCFHGPSALCLSQAFSSARADRHQISLLCSLRMILVATTPFFVKMCQYLLVQKWYYFACFVDDVF